MRRVVPALLYAGLIFTLSSFSSFPVPKGIWSFDKVIHLCEYAVLGFLVAHALKGRIPWAIAIAALYGVSDEVHQSFVPGRSADPYDALADLAGSTVGAIGFHIWRGLRVK